jgi:hypothetical protein
MGSRGSGSTLSLARSLPNSDARKDCAQLCPKLCPRGAGIDPKPPHASQPDKEKPLSKSATYRGVFYREGGASSKRSPTELRAYGPGWTAMLLGASKRVKQTFYTEPSECYEL